MSEESGGKELRTWNGIAHHLNVSVRTAQNWERERGLPVRRMAGDKPQVAAWSSELDEWRKTQAQLRIASAQIASSPEPKVFLTHLAACCLFYALLFVLDLFLEISYGFDQFFRPAAFWALILFVWIGGSSAAGLWVGWAMVRQGKKGGFVALLAVFSCSGLLSFLVLSRFVLPATPVTRLDFPAQTAHAAYLKNVVLYFLPLIIITLLVPFHYLATCRRRLRQQAAFRSGFDNPAPEQADTALFVPVRYLVIGMLIQGFTSIILTQDLLRHLLPSPWMNLFMMLAISKSALYGGVGMLCVGWYARAMESTRLSLTPRGQDVDALISSGASSTTTCLDA